MNKKWIMAVVLLVVLPGLACSFSVDTEGETPEPTVAPMKTPIVLLATPTAPPAAIPTVPSWPPVLTDDFDDPDSGFIQGSDEERRWFYEDGHYGVEVLVEDLISWVYRGDVFSDFILEVDVVPQSDAGEGGVIFRREDTYRLYAFTIAPDGRYRLRKQVTEGDWENILDWQESRHIRTGLASNRLRVVCVGSTISLYANGQYLDTVRDTTLTEGKLGLTAGTLGAETHALFHFDNLRVYAAAAASEPTPTVPAPEGPSFSDLFFASGATEDGNPIDVATSFPAGTSIVYAFASYEGMSDGADCASVWYLDGEEEVRSDFEWSLGQSGETWIANINDDDGLPPGRYDWELYVEEELVLTGSFAVQGGPAVLFEDDFSDPGSGWQVRDTDSGSVGYGGGSYIVISREESVTISGRANRSYDNLVIEVDATQVSAPANDNNDYGVVCRRQANGDAYYLLISGDGKYSIQKNLGDEFVRLVDWTSSDAIRRGNATNRIRAVCDSSDLMLFANGELLAEVSDSAFFEGDIGLTAMTYEDEPTEIHFDNLVVSAP